MIADVLVEWNPWWHDAKELDKFTGISRPKYQLLLDSIKIKEITIILGVRRAGKSTLMYQMIDKLFKEGVEPKQILFVNFEDKNLIDCSIDELYLDYKENVNTYKKSYIFFDEIHRKEDWEAWLRKKYDQKTEDKFVISGSCSYLLRKEYATLLTGRNLTFEIYPLDFKEYLQFKKVEVKGIIPEKIRIEISKNLKEYMEFGGFPEILEKPQEFKKRILQQYFDDILYKDIIDRHSLNSEKAKELAIYFMTNFNTQYSLRAIRNSLGLSYETTKDYLTYFKEAFLFFTLDHFSYSFKEQKTFPSKIYVIDTGLRNSVRFKFSDDFGRLVEGIVYLSLKNNEKELYYWKNRGEVDFIIKNQDSTLTAINVAYTNDIGEREEKALIEFRNEYKKAKELIIITKDLEKMENGIQFIPLWKWLLRKVS